MSDQVTIQTVLTCENLSKIYREGPQDIHVLKALDFSVQQGERVAIIGKSGAGKTTLLNMLGGLDLPTSGRVIIQGQDIRQLNPNQRGALRNRSLGFVYQLHHLLAEFTALENVAMPLLVRGDETGKIKSKAELLLQKVGLGERFHHKPAALSGGERQRVAIARALVTQPACVLLDEPTGNLDQHTADAIHELMLQLSTDLKTSFVVVTHDNFLAEKMDRILQLVDGQLQPLQ